MRKRLRQWLCVLLCLFVPLSGLAYGGQVAYGEQAGTETKALPAFPGAEGFGAAAKGGRGGEVYHVYSDKLTGPGTLHDALTTAGEVPRTIVFDISGEITIPQIIVRNKANITVAGQTAPGEGVTIRGDNIRFVNCDDIIIRHLRFRMGKQSANDDTLYVENSRNVIIDHSSFSWGTDEVLSILSKDYDNPTSRNITVQWSIISEGLLTHSMGGLIEMTTISMHHNLYAHNNDRNPKTKGQIDFVNNIVYNWGDFPYVAGGESGTKGYGNVVGNMFIAGLNSADPQYAVVRGNENYQVYLHNNRIDSNLNGVLDGTDTGAGMMETERPSVLVPERFEYPPVHTQEPKVAYEYILEYAGASLARDAVDRRVVNSVRHQTGAIIGHEEDVGGFPKLKREAAPRDTDRDGMPDEWEIAMGLDPYDPEDRNGDITGDGYTNLEKYLNELAAPGFPEGYPMEPPAWSGQPFQPPVEPEPENPGPVPQPSRDGQWVRNVIVRDNIKVDNDQYWSVQPSLQPGDLVAGDRTYRFVTIPEEVKGAEWIRSAVDSRRATNDDLLSFYVAADAWVYVAHDSRISPQPAWLDAYEPIGMAIEDDQPVRFNLYRKHAPAGSCIVTGSNNGPTRMNYFVIIQPNDAEAGAPQQAPAGVTGQVYGDGGELRVSWAPVDGADAYLIYRASSRDMHARAVGSSSSTVYIDEAIEQGVIYYYKVSALSAGGEGPVSAPVEVLNYDPSLPQPDAPEGLFAAETRSLSVSLAWTPVEGAMSYYVYRGEAGAEDFMPIASVSEAVYTDRMVQPATDYIYAVAVLGEGGESARSGLLQVTTDPPVSLPQAPDGLESGQVSAKSFQLKWNPVDNAEQYHIYRKTEKDTDFTRIASVDIPAYADRSIQLNQVDYRYRITAENEMGETEFSEELAIQLPSPEAPSNLRVGLVGDTFVGLIWTSGEDKSQVNIYREKDGEVELAGTAKVNTFYDRHAEPDAAYTYYVQAENGAGESEASNRIAVTPGLMTVLERAVDEYQRTEEIGPSLAGKLTQALTKAKQHRDNGENGQAAMLIGEFMLHLEADQQATADARESLLRNANMLKERLELETQAGLKGIEASPAKVQLNIGEQKKLEIYGIYEEHGVKRLLSGVTFTVSDPEIAEVDSMGVLSSKQAGTVTVTAEFAGYETNIAVETKRASSGGGNGPVWPGNPSPSPGTEDDGQQSAEPGHPPGGGTDEPGQSGVKLADINGHWAEEAVKQAVEAGFVHGFEDGTFRPDAPVTREQFVHMLVQALQLEAEAFAELPFTDWQEIGPWSLESVKIAAARKIVQGYPGRLAPQEPLSRVQMAAMAVRALQLSEPDEAQLLFADAKSIPLWAVGEVKAAVQAGIIQGRDNNRLMPNAAATRAEAVVLLLRLLEHSAAE